MIENLEFKGKWKLPNEKDWVVGTLSFGPDIGAKLEVFGTFNSDFGDRSSKEIILGETILEGDITLIDVWYRNSKHSNGIIVSTYEPIFIIKGYHFENINDISFRKVIFRVFNLFQWLNTTGLKYDFEQTKESYSISYNKLNDILFLPKEKCNGKISFESILKSEDSYNRIDLHEQANIVLEYQDKIHFKDILKDIRHIIGLFTLLTFEQSYPISITFSDEDYFDKIREGKRRKFIECFYQNNSYDSKYKLRRPHEHLVKYIDIQNIFSEIINKWIRMYTEQESVFILMLYSFRRKDTFSIEKFMDNVRALESYHRNTHNNNRLSEKEYIALVNKILNSLELNKEDTEWLANKLRGNEPSLSKRLKELVNENQNSYIKENIINKGKFSLSVSNTRNYYTHYDKSLEKKRLKGKELFDITLDVMGLLYSCILVDLGIDSSDFESGLKYHLYK